MSIQNIKHCSFLLLFTLFFTSTFHHTVFSQTKDQVLNLMWQGVGGKQSWEEARYFMFSCKTDLHTFVSGEHSYIWDRVSGDCRFEGISDDQRKLVVLFNTKNRKGKAFVNNAVISVKDSAQMIIKPVIDAFFNDSFWLFFPNNLSNTATLQIRDQELIGNTRYYVIEVNTPTTTITEFRSKLFIDTNTGKIFQWQTTSKDGILQYNFLTSNFKDVGGGLTLATLFTDTNTGVSIRYPIVSAMINVESDKFTKP